MRKRDKKIWKILAGLYMVYSITADIILLMGLVWLIASGGCLLYTSPSPRDLSTSRMPSSA